MQNISGVIRNQVVNPKGIRKQNLSYIIIWILTYAWLAAFAICQKALPLMQNVIHSDYRIPLQATILLSSVIFIAIVKNEWYIETVQIGAACATLGSIFVFAPYLPLRTAGAFIIAISLGLINVSILIPFVLILNNTEKQYAAIVSHLIINLFLLIQNANQETNLNRYSNFIVSILIMVMVFGITFWFRKSDMTSSGSEDDGNFVDLPRKSILILLISCVLVAFCAGVGVGILNLTAESVGNSVVVWHNIGNLLGCFIYFAVYAFALKPPIIIGNIAFVLISMGLLCNVFISQMPAIAVLFSMLFGIGTTVSVIHICFIIGVVCKKFNSMRYLKTSMFFIGVCGGLPGMLVGNFIYRIRSYDIAMIVSIGFAFLLMLFIILSPLLVKDQCYSEWAKDSEMRDIDNDQSYLFQQYQLSKREIEVCKLLLKGYTLRQIGAMLSISYSTVNTYYTNLYRKLNINSRTELLILFKEYVTK